MQSRDHIAEKSLWSVVSFIHNIVLFSSFKKNWFWPAFPGLNQISQIFWGLQRSVWGPPTGHTIGSSGHERSQYTQPQGPRFYFGYFWLVVCSYVHVLKPVMWFRVRIGSILFQWVNGSRFGFLIWIWIQDGQKWITSLQEGRQWSTYHVFMSRVSAVSELLEASLLSFKVLNRGLKKYFALFEWIDIFQN